MEQSPQQIKQQIASEKSREQASDRAQDYFEIDLLEIGRMFLSYWLVILLALAIGVGAGCAYQKIFVGRSYQADASIFIANTDSVITISDMQLSSELTVDYQKIITSRATLKRVIADLGLKMDYIKLRQLISVSADNDSHVITMKVTTDNKDLSLRIANSLLNTGIDRIQNVITGSEATIVDSSTSDAVIEVTPSILKYGGIGGLLAMLLVMLILIALYLSDTSLKMEDDVVESLGLPVLAGVPYYGSQFDLVKDKLDYYQKEAFNTLCGNIMLSGYDVRAVAVTSSAPNEGKSSLAYKIAETLTDHDKLVAYVDCDMRNSTLYATLGLEKSKVPGLSQYLSSDADISSVLHKADNNDKLHIIFSGKNPPSASALLSSERFKNLVKMLRDTYDYVIFDTPPVNLVIDGVFIATECDGTMLVVESGVTEKRQAERAVEELLGGGANIMGVVINKLFRNRNKYGYGYGKYGRYGYGKKYGYGKYGYGKKYGYGYGKKYGYGYGKGYGKGYGYGYGYGYGHGYGVSPEMESENQDKDSVREAINESLKNSEVKIDEAE